MAEKKKIANVLSNRYASAELSNLWSPEAKIVMERQLWIAVMRAQKDLGVDIPAEAIAAYGYDAEDVDREIAADAARADRLGLVLDSDPRHDRGADCELPASVKDPADQEISPGADT